MDTPSNLLASSAVNTSRDDLTRAWGITPGYWLWPTPIKILFVIDGFVNLTSDGLSFGLGNVLDTLQAPVAWWVRFDVDVAKRDGTLDPHDLGTHQLKYSRFKFTDAGFHLDSYDQVWFFGNNPTDFFGPVTDADIPGGFPLDDAELKLLAEWMDRGGGVFAAGDHSILGASMCSRIPRVRTMRKWTLAHGVPTKFGSTRHRTLQPTTQDEEVQEQDVVLQPLELVYRTTTGPLPFVRPLVPHPLLCSPRGVIDRFPDHMHEGEVVAEDEVQLDLPLGIPGYDRPEYPFVIPEALASGPGDIGGFNQRPRPHVIAYGRTTNDYFVPPVATDEVARLEFSSPFASKKRFGLIGVYDGAQVGIGRVVVDSTWHHWFSLNLLGLVTQAEQPEAVAMFAPDLVNSPGAARAAYEKMQAYYRNVGLWLATPAQRASMLVSGTWGALTGSPPMAFDTEMGPWEVGERVLEILRLTISQCMLGDLVAPLLDQRILAASAPPDELGDAEPSWSGLPDDFLNRGVMGGIGTALLELAWDDRERRGRGQRTRLDGEAIRQRAVKGVALGHDLVRQSVYDSAATLAALSAKLEPSATPKTAHVVIPIEVRRFRVVAEALQLPDPRDPALMHAPIALTIRIKLDDAVVVSQTLDRVVLPAFDERGSVIDLNREIGEVEAQAGERLSIEVLVGTWKSEQVNLETIRFKEILGGDMSEWIGQRMPDRSQAWRLWYRIEDAGMRSSEPATA